MLDKEKRFIKVITFYQSLPAPLLEEIIDNIHNRKIERKLNKIKSSKEKVKMLMSRECRELFIDTAFETIKDRISLSLNTSSYDDIITSINEDNKLYIAIFFFRWCYESGDDSSSNNDRYFDSFVDSETFDYILNDKKLIAQNLPP